MNNNYYGITRSTTDTTLQHYKYIRREKVNGKWKYYYKGETPNNSSDSATTSTNDSSSNFTTGKTEELSKRGEAAVNGLLSSVIGSIDEISEKGRNFIDWITNNEKTNQENQNPSNRPRARIKNTTMDLKKFEKKKVYKREMKDRSMKNTMSVSKIEKRKVKDLGYDLSSLSKAKK